MGPAKILLFQTESVWKSDLSSNVRLCPHNVSEEQACSGNEPMCFRRTAFATLRLAHSKSFHELSMEDAHSASGHGRLEQGYIRTFYTSIFSTSPLISTHSSKSPTNPQGLHQFDSTLQTQQADQATSATRLPITHNKTIKMCQKHPVVMRCVVCVLPYAERYEIVGCRWAPHCAGEVEGDELTVFEGKCWRCGILDWIPDPAEGDGEEDAESGAEGQVDQGGKGKRRSHRIREGMEGKDKAKGGREG
ncbi:hypothetical protein BDY17DRAFT_111674 [Neohortaea acidophila]|uniref:Uncharacterized protein n=1 Tax=Neohortaea acidophila TaxID=245834 RepID=A0A6A6Q191_9PEZI|nr:uncharacterized protein BDY17DRAFT_111674 [Neohortaea acidophila]KAF2485791.1 hypothetical protein BDY17DRAFT_111674 [Neohortaea acidophila]